MKLLVVPKQACNATEGLCQNTVLCCNLQFIICIWRSRAALFIKLFRILDLYLCRKTWTWWGVFLFIILRMFHFFQAIFATKFNVMFKDHLFCSHIFNKLAPKSNNYFKHKMTSLWAMSQRIKGHWRCSSLIPV